MYGGICFIQADNGNGFYNMWTASENKNLVGGGLDFLSGGYEPIFGWWGDSPHLPSRENPVLITYVPESFRILFIYLRLF